MRSPLDEFIAQPDVRERFEQTVKAPASLVMDVAEDFDLQSLSGVRAIFWLRERVMRAKRPEPRTPQGLIAEMSQIGWGALKVHPGRLVVYGAACQPWNADVHFRAIPADAFATYSEPGQVKIAWTLEAETLGPTSSRFAHETRVVATDADAGVRFRRYWRWARFGIVAIRLLLMPAVRRRAEKRFLALSRSGGERKAQEEDRAGR